MTMRTFYFNTGVKPYNQLKLCKGQIWLNGTMQIPFECDNVPENASFQYACDNPNIEKNNPYWIVREIKNSALLSKYAYFLIF